MTSGVTASIGVGVRMLAFSNSIGMEHPIKPASVLSGMSKDRCENGKQNSREETGDPTRHTRTVSQG